MTADAFAALRARAMERAGDDAGHRDVFETFDSRARAVRLFAMRSLPRDVRERVEKEVERSDWAEFREATKALMQSRRERRRDVIRELTRLGCEPREDSKLCAGFVRGSLFREKLWTAKQVARRMAEMKYIHEYCEDFRNQVNEMEEKFEELCDEYMGDEDYDDDYDDDYDTNTYYDRLDRADAREAACEDATGYRYFDRYVHDLAENWTDFPARWPWLADRDEGADLKSESDTSSNAAVSDSSGESSDDDDENDAGDDANDDDDDDNDDGGSEDDFGYDSGDPYARHREWYEDSD